jgi:hypothetical protein
MPGDYEIWGYHRTILDRVLRSYNLHPAEATLERLLAIHNGLKASKQIDHDLSFVLDAVRASTVHPDVSLYATLIDGLATGDSEHAPVNSQTIRTAMVRQSASKG